MNTNNIAPYVLRALARHQLQGRLCTLHDLVEELGVRRGDVRRTVSALHKEGYVDALRMRLTLSGFAIGNALMSAQLPPLRPAKDVAAAAA